MSPILEGRVTLNNISWGFYQAMRREIGNAHIRLTFDQGRLEILSPSGFHEAIKTIIGRLIEAYADESGIVVEGMGSTTFSRDDLQKGLEPDECYYIAHAAQIIGKQELDLTVDPPPDLAIEVDISPPGVARQPIYAALGVPEIWRYDGRRLICLHRHTEEATGPRYIPADQSISFPQLSLADLGRFVEIARSRGQSAAVQEFRAWLRYRSAHLPRHFMASVLGAQYTSPCRSSSTLGKGNGTATHCVPVVSGAEPAGGNELPKLRGAVGRSQHG